MSDKKVLIVSRMKTVAFFLKRIINSFNPAWEVLGFIGAADAWEEAKKEPGKAFLIICDIDLSGEMAYFELLDKIKESFPQIKFLVVANSYEGLTFGKKKPDFVILKPVYEENLNQIIKTI